MPLAALPAGPTAIEEGCAFIIDGTTGGGTNGACGARRRPDSAYCPAHHAMCHIAGGSPGERRALREIEALAAAVGGRRGQSARQPSAKTLQRLERAARTGVRGAASSRATATSAKRTAPRERLDAAAGAPSAERRQRGPVERLEQTIGDVDGRPSRPYRAVDTLTVMQRRGTITAGMKQAGEDFRARFTLAQLDPLRAFDPAHLRLGGARPARASDPPGQRIEAARDAVWRAIQAVGGIASPAGSCLWHVLGWERSLKEWALEQGWSGKRVSPEAASGILVAALGALETEFVPKRQ